MTYALTITHLYPVEMNIYGDRGNVLTLCKRMEWRGITANVVDVGVGEPFDPSRTDIVFAGGGQDRGQVAVGLDLQSRTDALLEAAEAGVVMLVVCGTYQLFGRRFQTLEGHDIPGIGLFKADTIGSTQRLIGNVTIETRWGPMVGFENHSGQTTLDPGEAALGDVIKGYGNNATDKVEGALHHNVHGTYLHGPVLPRNPAFADHLIGTAMRRRYDVELLEPLDDTLERAAAKVVMDAPR
ncbi:MAG: glutamine amidotransferase [Actinobacteria bacterium]|nr:glutamine amidotransferase [Actinomycetota bacterium]